MKICIIGGGISDALKGNTIGGAEIQQARIAKGLLQKGMDVFVLEYYLPAFLELEGIKFYPAWNSELLSFRSKLKNILKNIDQQKPEVIYARGTQLYVGLLYAFLKMKHTNIKLLWGIAGDHDLTSKFNGVRLNQIKSLYGKLNAGILFNMASFLSFHFSDAVICQTKIQMDLAKKKSVKKKHVHISNIFETEKLLNKVNNTYEVDAIWVGHFSGIKGEDILLKIAIDIPEIKILCLGHISEDFKKTDLFEKIEKQENLIVLGRVPSRDVSQYIAMADFVLNTSPSEGLSNVFLEGWHLEKPVVSYRVNPNDYLTTGEAGFFANGSYENLQQGLKDIMKNKDYMQSQGEKGKEILMKYHNPEYILNQFITLIEEV